MKFSKKTLDDVQSVDIVQLAGDLGFQGIKRRGARHIALCPWHNDEHASCHIGGPGSYAHVVKCFACGESAGSNIDLVMKIKGLSFREAVLWIAGRYGIAVEEETEAKGRRLMAKDKRLKAKDKGLMAKGKGLKANCHQPAEMAGDSSTSLCSAQNDGSEGNAREKPLEYCGIEEVHRRVSTGNALCLCLKDFFPSDVVDQVTMMYQLGTDYAVDSRCHTLFPSIDRWGRVHDVKLQVYDINRSSPRYGHSQATYWVGKRLLLREDGTEYGRDTECMFGEHLLALRPSATVGLVESPKNAIVCACHWPDLVWVATGNKGMLKRSVLAPLAGRQVLVYPDLDAAEEWGAILSCMQDLATFQMSDFVNTPRTEENKKMDIADFVLMRNLSINNLFDDKDQDNAWHKEKCSCNYISHRVARECWGVEKNNGG